MTIQETCQNIRCDASRYEKWMFHPGFWVTLSYRIRFLRKNGGRCSDLLLPLDLLFGIMRYIISDTKIPSKMSVGSGLYLPHPTGIIINDMCQIGDGVAIFQQVTLGEWQGKAPLIESNCSLFAGAKIFGGVTIGLNCKIGANCVVNKDIPANSSVSTTAVITRQRGI